MSLAQVTNLHKRFGKTVALEEFNLTANKGEVLVLLGPSGCGKTTLLRSIAGLERPDSGEILLGDELVFSEKRGVFTPPHLRRIGMVFQNYALWPHLTVLRNVSYPLKVRRVPRARICHKVEDMLSLVQLDGLERRYPHELSGGQQQRVALARALVMDPRLLLLDEPLSSLDAKLREEMREELKRVHDETELTMLYVTHDQTEAMALADRIGVMESGRLIQLGPPPEIYERPGTEFVARFIGVGNLLSGEVKTRNGDAILALENGESVPLSQNHPQTSGPVLLTVRPEEIAISRSDGGLAATIKSVTYLGNAIEYRLQAGTIDLRARTDPKETYSEGEQVFVRFNKAVPVGPYGQRRCRHRQRKKGPHHHPIKRE
jgi:iron(III) transport system ATP-binding protein